MILYLKYVIFLIYLVFMDFRSWLIELVDVSKGLEPSDYILTYFGAF